MNYLIAIILTLLIGPATFFILSRFVYRKLKYKKYPVCYVDGYGDIIFIPIFNGVLAYKGAPINFIVLTISIFLAFLLTISFIYWRKNLAIHNDWSRPHKGIFDIGGWYHSAFMLAQAFIIFYAILTNSGYIWLWLPLIGYLSTVYITFRTNSKITY
jgi:hypothetical protein